MSEIGGIILGIIIGVVIGYLIHQSMTNTTFSRRIKSERSSAIKQSKAVSLGHISEQLAPIMPNFPYHIKDMVFIGKGFDYLVLDWLSEWQIRKIIFVEIKTGRSSQNLNERMIQHVVNNKFVSYELIRI